MKIGMVNKLTSVNRCVLRTSHRNITNLAEITCKTIIKIDILKGGGKWERAKAINDCNTFYTQNKELTKCITDSCITMMKSGF